MRSRVIYILVGNKICGIWHEERKNRTNFFFEGKNRTNCHATIKKKYMLKSICGAIISIATLIGRRPYNHLNPQIIF